MRILITDDHSVVRRGLKQILQNEFPSAFIDEGSDAEMLVKKVIKEDWDLVITDISMPFSKSNSTTPNYRSWY
jgi:two-component system invasion response regulator UvrY